MTGHGSELPQFEEQALTHKRRAAPAILLCMAVFGTAPSQGQDWPQLDGRSAPDGGVLELTLEDAVRRALEHNRGFVMTRENREVEKLNLAIEKDRWAPTLSLGSTATRNQTSSSGTGTANVTIPVPTTRGSLAMGWSESLSDSSDNTRALSLKFTQPLLKGGPAIADHAIRTTRIKEQSSILTLRTTTANLISRTITMYRALIKAVRQVELAEAALRRAQDQLATTRALIEAGRVARREAIRSEATIANRELALVTSRNSLDEANLNLVDHLAFDDTLRIHPLASLRLEHRNVDHALVLEDALRLRPDFLSAQLNVESARIALETAQNNLLPAVGLNLNMSRTYHVQTNKPTDTTSSVSLNASIPLNDRQTDVKLVEARLKLRQEERKLTRMRASIDTEVRRAVTDVTVNLRRTDLAREARELAESNLEIEKRKFSEGLASSTDVATSQDNLVQAEMAEVEAIEQYLAALRKIDEVSGRTLERWNVRLEMETLPQ